jgi:hypothetical protein
VTVQAQPGVDDVSRVEHVKGQRATNVLTSAKTRRQIEPASPRRSRLLIGRSVDRLTQPTRSGVGYSAAVSEMSRAQLDALVEEATVDCSDEEEQVTGLYTMIVDHLAVPFQTTILGVDVTVEDIDMTGRGDIVARCSRGAFEQVVSLHDLPLPTPRPEGEQWIEAYRYWAR